MDACHSQISSVQAHAFVVINAFCADERNRSVHKAFDNGWLMDFSICRGHLQKYGFYRSLRTRLLQAVSVTARVRHHDAAQQVNCCSWPRSAACAGARAAGDRSSVFGSTLFSQPFRCSSSARKGGFNRQFRRLCFRRPALPVRRETHETVASVTATRGGEVIGLSVHMTLGTQLCATIYPDRAVRRPTATAQARAASNVACSQAVAAFVQQRRFFRTFRQRPSPGDPHAGADYHHDVLRRGVVVDNRPAETIRYVHSRAVASTATTRPDAIGGPAGAVTRQASRDVKRPSVSSGLGAFGDIDLCRDADDDLTRAASSPAMAGERCGVARIADTGS